MKVSTIEGEKTSYNQFAQQQLPAWRPIITPNCALVGLAILAVFSFIVGGIFLVKSQNTIEITKRYDNICSLNDAECKVSLTIPSEMKGKVYLKYKLTKYYQAHRRFMESRNDEQLAGQYANYNDMSLCAPLRSENDSKNSSDWILPCGLSAISFFNDTYTVSDPSHQFSDKGIAWETDIEWLYKNLSSQYTDGNKWLEQYKDFPGGQTNEHFIVWMRVASIPTVVKTYSICNDCTIPPGEFEIKIKNSYPTTEFNGHKYIMLVTDSITGGKNDFLGVTYIVVGFVCVLFIIGLVIDKVFNPRKLGDMKMIVELVEARNREVFMRPAEK